MSGPYLPALDLIQQTGFDPRTGLPCKFSGGTPLKNNIRAGLRVLDQQNAINRYRWYNLPKDLNGQLLERILYYRGQGIFFYMSTNDMFYFLPFALDGNLDVYGRYMSVTPVAFAGGSTGTKEQPWIQGLSLKPKYDIILPEDWDLDIAHNSCVILKDYTSQISQHIIPRQVLNEPVVDTMADCIPFMRTALLNATGVQGMRVQSEDEQSNVNAASLALNRSALNGEKWVPIVGQIEFQELTSGTTGKAEEFMMAMQSLDNYRLSLFGLDQGGLFQKKSHMLEAEQEMNQANTGLVMQDGLTLRQEFCNIVNSIWGLGIWCEPSETTISVDIDGNGILEDSQAEETEEVSEDEPIDE